MEGRFYSFTGLHFSEFKWLFKKQLSQLQKQVKQNFNMYCKRLIFFDDSTGASLNS